MSHAGSCASGNRDKWGRRQQMHVEGDGFAHDLMLSSSRSRPRVLVLFFHLPWAYELVTISLAQQTTCKGMTSVCSVPSCIADTPRLTTEWFKGLNKHTELV